MAKIHPKDGVKYLTNLSLRFLVNQKLGEKTNPSKWSTLSLAKFLEKHGFVKLKYRPDGKAYTYECIKEIDLPALERLAHYEEIYNQETTSLNFQNKQKAS